MRPMSRPSPGPRTGVLLAALVLVAGGCGRDEPAGGGSSGAPAGGALTVFAAASLTEAFEAIKPGFEAANGAVQVTFNFAGSQALAGQIQQGAPADVFASADTTNMDKLLSDAMIDGQPAIFAGNRLQVAVAPGNPKGVKGLADLADPGLKVVLCAPDVPAGRYSAQALEQAGVTVEPVSEEDNVKAAVNKVVLGEADATIVYATDLTATNGEAEAVEIPDEQNVTATYPAAVVKDARNAAAAKAFVDYLISEAGQSTLKTFGFLPASSAA